MTDTAVHEKDLGNAAYKSRDFVKAHVHYDRAIELDPSNIAFYSNKAAAYLEESKHDECIAICMKAVDIGREQRADYKLIAKVMARAGNAYQKKDDLKEALNWFGKSLFKFRDPELEKKVKELEKKVKELEKKVKEQEIMAYINPELAQEEQDLANDFFKNGQYTPAMKHYNEAVKRDPDNAILYSNRAACLCKLKEFLRALEDSENSIKKNPSLINGYLVKGEVLLLMKNWQAAEDVFRKALDIDHHNVEGRSGLRKAIKEAGLSTPQDLIDTATKGQQDIVNIFEALDRDGSEGS